MPAPLVTLFVPGLIWPNAHAYQLTHELALPALQTILGRARREDLPAESDAEALAHLFGCDTTPDALLRRMGEATPPLPQASAALLCADPVHLAMAHEHLLLSSPAHLQLQDDEVRALLAALNELLARQEDLPGLHLEAPHPQRWYLHLPAAPHVQFTALDAVIGRNITGFLPHGEEAARYNRLGNELQMCLHAHPVNQARRARGALAVNSLWFWGTAQGTPPAAQPPAPRVLAEEPFARGLCRAAKVPAEAVRALRDVLPLADDVCVMFTRLRRPAIELDLARWQQALVGLEQDWLAPALRALAQGHIRALRLLAPGERFSLAFAFDRRARRFSFWRKPRRLEEATGLTGRRQPSPN